MPRRGGFLLGIALAVLPAACGQQPDPALEPRTDAPATSASQEGRDSPGSPNARWGMIEDLREFRDAVRHPSDGGGRAWLEWPDGAAPKLEARGRGRFPLVFQVGPEGIAEGGQIFLQVSPFWEWSTPQTRYPDAPGFTSVTTSAAQVELESSTLGEQLLGIEVKGRALLPGEQVRIVYGAGPALARVDHWAERESPLLIAVDGDGDGIRHLIENSPTVDIDAGQPARLVLFLPAVARPGDPVDVSAAVLDGAANAGVGFEGELTIEELPVGLQGPIELVPVVGSSGLARQVLTASAPGVYRIRARGPGGLEAESNPMLVSESAPRILWADLHGHSNFSDGTGTPEDFYRYARDVAALDVAALTDHDHWGFPFLDEAPERWRHIQDTTRSFHEPSRFVTLLGYEWTSWAYGHRHVLHFEDEAVLHSFIAEETDTPQELWEALGDSPALTFAHHSAGEPVATDWTIPPDPDHEPVTEIASVHGSSESSDTPRPVRGGIPGNWVRDALGRGYRLGFIGSGDSHDGHPGLVQLANGTGGIAGILSEEATREGVLEALRSRRSYATNGPRIVLIARLDGALMGAALPAAERHQLLVRVASPGPLASIEIIADGKISKSVPGEGRRELTFESEFGPSSPGGSLYLRVLQEDGGAAWSSPFFFE